MPALLIDRDVQTRIAAALAFARAHPLPLSVVRAGAVLPDRPMLSLQDRKPGFERPPGANVLIPVGYRAAVSIEEQPAGMCIHVSISVDRPGKLPSREAVAMIADAFGLTRIDSRWLEEFEPGKHAVNVLQVIGEGAHGNA
jgi:hypothetical protein